MQEHEYFKNALSNFTHEAASGGAIRHLTDLGYTANQIMDRLDFPTPYARVQKTVWEYLLETGMILLTEPEHRIKQKKAVYVKEYGKYGKASFRLVSPKKECIEPLYLKEQRLKDISTKELSAFLSKKCDKNGEMDSYVSCDFGLRLLKSPEGFLNYLQILGEQQRDYILGLPWEKKICYHRLNMQMQEIVTRLYENGDYHGSFHFLKTEEKIIF